MYRNFMIAVIGAVALSFGTVSSAEASHKAGHHHKHHAKHVAKVERACPFDILSRMREARAERPVRVAKPVRAAKVHHVKKERVARHVAPSKGKAPKHKA